MPRNKSILLQILTIYFIFISLQLVAQMPDPTRVYYYPDDSSNGKENAKIIRFFINKSDTIAVGNYYLTAFETTTGTGIIGNKSGSWYLFDSTGVATLIPYKDYIGKGLFAVNNIAKFDVFSLSENKIIFEGLDSFEVFNTENSYQSVLPVGVKNSIRYTVNELGRISVNKESVMPADSTVKNKYYHGLEVKLVDGSTKKIVPCKYEIFKREYFFSYGKLKDKYYIYNELFQLISETTEETYSVIAGLVKIKNGSKYGVVDLSGKAIVPCEYDSISQESVIKAFKKNETVIFLPSGKIIYESKIGREDIRVKKLNEIFYNDFNTEKQKFLVYDDISSKAIDLTTYQSILCLSHPSKKLIKAKKNNKTGIINMKGDIVLPLEFDSIGDYFTAGEAASIYDGRYLVKKDNNWFLMDMDFNRKSENYEDIEQRIENINHKIPSIIWIKRKGKFDVINYYNDKELFKGADSVSIIRQEDYHQSKWAILIRIFKGNNSFLIDTNGKRYFEFKNLEVISNEKYAEIVDNYLNKIPLNITPYVTINDVMEVNTEHDYAHVYCLNRYFIINKYGEISFGTETPPENYDYKTGNIFVKHLKSSKGPGLYTFNGRELGKLSKYPASYQEFDMITQECYYIFTDVKNRKGLMRANGELVLNCEYLDIGTIYNGKCEVLKKKGEEPYIVDLASIQSQVWPK